MPLIHPSAVIEPGAQLAPDVTVGAFCYVGPQVTLGPRCILHHHASIEGRTTAGADNEFFPNSVIGAVSQDLKYRGGDCKIIIGDNNRFREAATVHIGTEEGGGITALGDNNLIMINVHVAHDCRIGSNCIIANNTMLAGHVEIDDWVVFAGAVAVTHFVRVGRHAFIGGVAGVVHDVPPFMVSDGHPARARGLNLTGLRRRGFSNEQIKPLREAYTLLFSKEIPFAQAAPEAEARFADSPEVQHLLAFMKASNDGKHGRYLESQRGKNRWEGDGESAANVDAKSNAPAKSALHETNHGSPT
jgi:UDP-N-acetylglucosamine acyltransferase